MKNRFHLCTLLVAFLILLSTPRFYAIRVSVSGPSSTATGQQPFRPKYNAPVADRARAFESEKRRVPTGSNPLHNKR
ncbi:hypothetical protein CIPAW_03G157300 [Carya illinoinensis]|nr:hypothetical protein CIPAW_03G157300 [Carya illinoinensis]